MITIEQCRAARGLIGWTQQDLADASGLSKTAINNFEKGHSDIKSESLKAIRMAFESTEIEFLGDRGLCKRADHVDILKGPMALSDLLDDIFETLKQDGGEVLITNMHAGQNAQLKPQKIQQHAERLKAHNITERILCAEGISNNWSDGSACRWLPKDTLQASMASFIYGSKVALELWDQTIIVIISSQEGSQAEQGRFEYLWKKAEISNTENTQKAQNA